MPRSLTMRHVFAATIAISVMNTAAAYAQTSDARRREVVRYGDVAIDTIVEGGGPAVVLLPSLARDSEDYDPVAEGLAKAGYRVLRPQPRGIGKSTGPMTGITLHDFARDVAETIKAHGDGRAVVVGHAYGNWVARMTAVDFPGLVRGVVIAAAAAKVYAPELTVMVTTSGDLSRSEADRLAALRYAFFAPGNDPRVWLHGCIRRCGMRSARPSPRCLSRRGGRVEPPRCSICRRSMIRSSRSTSVASCAPNLATG